MTGENVASIHVRRVHDSVSSGSQAAHSTVAASWCRSLLHFGLDPAIEHRPDRLTDKEISYLHDVNGELISVAKSVLDSLYQNVSVAGCCVILADAEGNILNARSTAGDEADFGTLNLVTGANWSEASEGTNGIGTCIAEQQPVTINRDEHFATRNIGVSCIDGPIFGPEGNLVGAVNISCARNDHNAAMSRLISVIVQDAAVQIERAYFCRHYSGASIVYLSNETGRRPWLFAVDPDGLVIGATRAARLQYNLSDEDLQEGLPIKELIGISSGPAGFADGDRAVLRQALARTHGNVAAAARSLGIGRATFYRRMDRIDLAPKNDALFLGEDIDHRTS